MTATAGLGARRSALGGLMVPETTPFDARGELDAPAFAANVSAHLGAGASGIVTAGSTGEAALLDESERAHLVEIARATVPTDRWLIAGVGGESTRATIARAKDAAARGADAVLVVAPHYYGGAMTNVALEAHYHAVADASPVPLILYNIPKYAHFALSTPLVAKLSRHANVIGIKDSSGDLAMLRGYVALQDESFTVLTGSGAGLLAARDLGAKGGILAVACFAPRRALFILSAHAGDAEAAESQEALATLARDIVATHGPAGVKVAMDAMGLVGGSARAPLPPLSEADASSVRALVVQLA